MSTGVEHALDGYARCHTQRWRLGIQDKDVLKLSVSPGVMYNFYLEPCVAQKSTLLMTEHTSAVYASVQTQLTCAHL